LGVVITVTGVQTCALPISCLSLPDAVRTDPGFTLYGPT